MEEYLNHILRLAESLYMVDFPQRSRKIPLSECSPEVRKAYVSSAIYLMAKDLKSEIEGLL